ncbi:GMC family oxidoreductase [Thalassotalea sp. 1_MG-2023]|uniref:GMC oxidoreductase n=1 Tax=Thalassotalea sp. 1_MG-2023 TaxID=3062680 RepID=UPI0026E194ED|nr:GMC family oxidoreductase [Thalassotalea sp. 1_MG-2023]MDO6427027.1 GMC family oxidoreductase [Thalassotalea sp. 1_MG-2023]
MQQDIYIQQSDHIYDALVVGSGVSGGWAAKELCERGLKTLMIERGRIVEHRKDYPTEGKGVWQYPNRMKVDNLLVEEQYKVQQQCYAFHDGTKHFFGNDKDLPYSTKKGTNFSWIRANQLGGKSLLWHRQSYRFSDYDFNANKSDGHGNDWPIRYDDIAPWYSHVEKHAGISGNYDGLPQLPDSEFLPPFDFSSPEIMLKDKFAKLFPERPMIMGRTAHLTKPTELHYSQGRVQCQARNECQKGCSFGAYFSTQSSTLPAAAKTGNLHIAPNSVVHSLIYDEKTNRVKGVRVVDNDDLSTREYYAKVVFLCASTLGTTQIMLNSTSKKFPNGIANSSGTLGHYLMDHNYNAGAFGRVEGFEDETVSGRRPTSIYIPNFQFEPKRYKDHYVRGYALAGGAGRGGWKGAANSKGIGVGFKQRLTQAGDWYFNLMAQGEMLPRFENHVALHSTKKDKWGIPQLHIDCTWSANEIAMMADAEETARDMLIKAGLKDVKSYNSIDGAPPGLAIHEVGTARMGRDPKDSVLNGFNQTHDIANLFVTDGASFCSSAVVNPSLTFMALTARAVDYAVKEMNAKRI